MKEIKAYIHRNRVAEVISALKSSVAWTTVGDDEHNLTAYMVKGLDLTRFNRHLIRSKLKRRKSDEESQLHSRIQG